MRLSCSFLTLPQCVALSSALLGLSVLLPLPARATTILLVGGTEILTTDDPSVTDIGCGANVDCHTDGATVVNVAGLLGEGDPHDGQDYIAFANPLNNTVEELLTYFPVDFLDPCCSTGYSLSLGAGPGTACAAFEQVVDQGSGCDFQEESGTIYDIGSVRWSDGGVDHIEAEFVPEPQQACCSSGTGIGVIALALWRRIAPFSPIGHSARYGSSSSPPHRF